MTLDILQFTANHNDRIFPVSKVILKALYHMPFDDTPGVISFTNPKTDQEYSFSEREYIDFLKSEDRYKDDGPSKRQPRVVILGELANRTFLAGTILAYEAYKASQEGEAACVGEAIDVKKSINFTESTVSALFGNEIFVLEKRFPAPKQLLIRHPHEVKTYFGVVNIDGGASEESTFHPVWESCDIPNLKAVVFDGLTRVDRSLPPADNVFVLGSKPRNPLRLIKKASLSMRCHSWEVNPTLPQSELKKDLAKYEV